MSEKDKGGIFKIHCTLQLDVPFRKTQEMDTNGNLKLRLLLLLILMMYSQWPFATHQTLTTPYRSTCVCMFFLNGQICYKIFLRTVKLFIFYLFRFIFLFNFFFFCFIYYFNNRKIFWIKKMLCKGSFVLLCGPLLTMKATI